MPQAKKSGIVHVLMYMLEGKTVVVIFSLWMVLCNTAIVFRLAPPFPA